MMFVYFHLFSSRRDEEVDCLLEGGCRAVSCALRQNEVGKIFEHPVVLEGSIDDAQKLTGQRDDGATGTPPGLHALVEVLQVGAVAGSDQGRLHQGRAPQLAATFVNVAAV